MRTSRLLWVLLLGLAPPGLHPAAARGPGGTGDMVAAYAHDLGLALDASAVARSDADPAFGTAPLASAELAELRGGFALPGGLSIAFGFDIETRIGGDVVQRLNLPQAPLGGAATPLVRTTDAQGRTGTLPLERAVPALVTDALNGGATRVTTQIGGGGIVGVLQNSRDGQLVQRTTSISIDVGGLRGMLDGASTREALRNGLGGGGRFGR
jgi:hypothetical protein